MERVMKGTGAQWGDEEEERRRRNHERSHALYKGNGLHRGVTGIVRIRGHGQPMTQ